MPEDRRRRRGVLSRYVLRFELPAGLWGPCRLQQLAAPTDPIRSVKRLRPCSSPSPPTARASWENKLVNAVADAGDGSSGIYEDRRTRRGRCLNYEILSNFFCSATSVDISRDVALRPVASRGRRGQGCRPAIHLFRPTRRRVFGTKPHHTAARCRRLTTCRALTVRRAFQPEA